MSIKSGDVMNRNRRLFMILLHTTITPVTHHLVITDYLVIRGFYVKRFSQNGAIKTKTFSKTLHILNPKFLKMRTNHSNLQKLFLIQRISSNKKQHQKRNVFLLNLVRTSTLRFGNLREKRKRVDNKIYSFIQ